MKDDRIYLEHILECIDRLQRYTEDGRGVFLEPGIVQDAVLRRLQTLAETTQRLPEDRKAAHPDVPWREIAGFRNVLVHDYLGIDVEQVWSILVHDIPPLREQIEAMLRAAE